MTAPAVFLMGPTASGKTALALALAEAIEQGQTPWAGVRLISVDSAQVFRGMDIGTAKPAPATLQRWPHALIDILDPAESYSAARFREDALAQIAAARAERQVPLLVGGTGLYFRALEFGLSALPPANARLRETLTAEAEQLGWAALHARLASVDAVSAAKISPNDPQRILRALEIHQLTGLSRSAHWAAPRSAGVAGPLIKFGLLPAERSDLHAAIAQRFHQMMEAGFLAEVESLQRRGDLHPGLPSIRSVGYRQLWEHLAGRCSLSDAVEQGIAATRQYAKRQITWLRSEIGLQMLNPQARNSVVEVIDRLRVNGLQAVL